MPETKMCCKLIMLYYISLCRSIMQIRMLEDEMRPLLELYSWQMPQENMP